MGEILLTCKSMTYAQRMKRALENNGFIVEIVRPDISLTGGNCGYAIKISQKFLPEAIDILKKHKLSPSRVILMEGKKKYRELKI